MDGDHIDEAIDWSIANNSVVYFIVRGSQVKIGTTRNLAKRFSELQCGSPDDYFVFGHMPGNEVIERVLHKKRHCVANAPS